jgi:uncharacterized protein YbjT (DUF2867 family)
MRKNVLVVGATGGLGFEITKALIAIGAEVTAMVRSTSNRSKLENLGVKNFVIGDMMNPLSLKNALSKDKTFDAIVASAAGYTGHSKGDNSKTDTIGYRNLVDASRSAEIPRFILISILESNNAAEVPHFYNKYLIERYLIEKKQPYIALRPGIFLNQPKDFILPELNKGVFPVFIPGVATGMIYTPDLARYAAMAATLLPNSTLNSSIDVGWEKPASGEDVAAAFEKVLGKKLKVKPVFPPFVFKYILPTAALINKSVSDLIKMIRWIKKGVYISKNTEKQKTLFGELPTIEEAVTRYCRDNKLIQ